MIYQKKFFKTEIRFDIRRFGESDVIQEESQLPHAIRVYDVTEFSAGHQNIRRNSQCRRVCPTIDREERYHCGGSTSFDILSDTINIGKRVNVQRKFGVA